MSMTTIKVVGLWLFASLLGTQLRNICPCSDWPHLIPSQLVWLEHCDFAPTPGILQFKALHTRLASLLPKTHNT